MSKLENLKIEGARILFKNFSGRPDKFHVSGGERTFSVVLNPEDAETLSDMGWNVKYLAPRNEEEMPLPYMQVKVNYGDYSPRVYMLTKGGKPLLLNEETICTLDSAELVNVDIILSPYEYDFAGRHGIKAYLKTGYFTIEDDFGGKYNMREDDNMPF